MQELPAGMHAIYDRMSSSITQNSSPSARALASTILQCTACSFRTLTVAELSQAINDDVSGLLDFQQSIVDLSGGFVVIDNGGNVAMVHQTAREYLLGNNERSFHVDRQAAHEQMFLSCMRCLMSTGLRGKVSRNSKPEFLDYSASWWSSHLSHTSLSCERVKQVLAKFLTGHWVLTWIHLLAANEQLRILVRASQHLSKYSAKWQKHDTVQSDQSNHMMQQLLLESWATDCMKIVGKFGSTLRRNPESIYKLIPPFCPPNSAIYQQFGKQEARTLLVSGQSMGNWDDALARLSLGLGTYAASISAVGGHIAVLALSGMVFVFNASTFEETTASPIRHGERVYRMKLSTSGLVLATYGFKTTKIWDVHAGTCKLSVQNVNSRPRPLTMLMTNNNTSLLVGTDDRQIRSLNLTESAPSWDVVAELEEPELEGHFLNSSSYMALNDDGSLIAVAYRGHPLSAWETDGPVHIGHCWRQRKELSRGEVIDAVWHPFNPEILGLYIEGVVFKWIPYDDEVNELVTGASKLAISRDGNLFATGDVHGIVKVYNTFDFSLLYQLASQDSVLDLTFSPDLRRFYDIRGYYGNAWEPSALMRFADHSGRGSESDSETTSLAQSATIPTTYSQKIQSITVLANSPRGRFYCCGTEYGNVRLFDKQRDKPVDMHLSKSFLSIEQMAWSADGEHVCFSDSSKKVYIKSVVAATAGSDATIEARGEVPMKLHATGPILQILFQSNSKGILIYTPSTICVISLESLSVLYTEDWHTDKYKWIVHPSDPSLLLGVGPHRIDVLDWDLVKLRTYEFDIPLSEDGQVTLQSTSNSSSIDRVLVAHDRKHVLVQVSFSGQQSKEKSFLCFDATSFSTSKSTGLDGQDAATSLSPILLPRSISSQVTVGLCLLSQDRLIFLSKDFSVCSWRLQLTSISSRPPLPPKMPSDSVTSIPMAGKNTMDRRRSYNTSSLTESMTKELFPLPGDWVGRDCLSLSCIWVMEKSLMVPRNGEVALVRSAALA